MFGIHSGTGIYSDAHLRRYTVDTRRTAASRLIEWASSPDLLNVAESAAAEGAAEMLPVPRCDGSSPGGHFMNHRHPSIPLAVLSATAVVFLLGLFTLTVLAFR